MKNCANCEYFTPNQCNRFPPNIKIHSDPLYKHPQVDPNDWCGEFKQFIKQIVEKPDVLGKKRK